MNQSVATALLIDFGSTYTKLRAIDLERSEIIGAGQGPSTVASDINVGLQAALADLEQRIGGLPDFKYRLASSSAAGGLRMVTVGLVKELTAEAARIAALGAGAKLIGTYAYRLTAGDIAEIEAQDPDILLLAGGTDGGNDEVILYNADVLACSALGCPVVVAGNRQATDEIAVTLASAGKPAVSTENVMPEFNVLNIEPARAAIRQIFIDRIVHAKGIDKAAKMFDQVLMPTPEAVMEGARLLADGTSERQGLGPLLVVDIGGATTDVHSVATGDPTMEGAIQRGLPEPYVKRTVEGDLGMRHNAASIVEAAGQDKLADDSGIPVDQFQEILDTFTERRGAPARDGCRTCGRSGACPGGNPHRSATARRQDGDGLHRDGPRDGSARQGSVGCLRCCRYGWRAGAWAGSRRNPGHGMRRSGGSGIVTAPQYPPVH